MAAVVPFEVKMNQFLVDSKALLERGKMLKIEAGTTWHRGELLIYEISPAFVSCSFLGDIPMRVVDLIVNIFKTLVYGAVSLVCFRPGLAHQKI